MLRQRTTAIAFLVIALSVLLFWPTVLTYTFVAGEEATADVARCTLHRQVRGENLVCTGTWRTEEGGTGSGEIYGLDEADAGRRVPVRIGPMGPYAGGFAHSWGLFVTALPLPLLPFVLLLVLRRGAPRRRLVRSLLAGPAGGTLFIVTADAVTHSDGRPHLSKGRPEPTPPALRRPDVPGRIARRHGRSVFETVAGINRGANELFTLSGPAGQPAMLVERRSLPGYEPDYMVMDPAGAAHALIRRFSPHPVRYALLGPGGAPLGSAELVPGTRMGALLVKDAQGAKAATAALSGRRWVLRAEDTAPPLLRDVAIVLTLAQCDWA